jgi:hypothetical protein
MKRALAALTKDGEILAKLGYSKISNYYWARRKHIFHHNVQFGFPLATIGLVGHDIMIPWNPLSPYEDSVKERRLAKAALLLKEAKEKGNLAQLMQLEATDPRHPYYYEHPWQSALKIDSYSLTPYQKYKKWHCLAFRAFYDWDRMGLLFDDLQQPQTMEPDIFLEEAIRRLPYAQRLERERRLSRCYDLLIRQEFVDEKDYTHPEDDVAYLIPYIAMVVDEHRETRDNLVDVYSR